MACEKCWNDAFVRSRFGSLSQAEHYALLLEERKDNPCGPEYESERYFREQEAKWKAEQEADALLLSSPATIATQEATGTDVARKDKD